ncbi:hypothetical protein BT96DRAFT_987496 [Gymnopus androsaceus JB14]|uniref:Sfi1 spindle body domain-containing protein n=1 Tax=Gymnopus androsaceus JB14 TaxID=1447944 RepID=A0A6A4I943_9AGAR|nr:hypothetical protein BT96DRAFT_987496 [Gymnopus androsaceus JB14]
MMQDEREADRFREEKLIERCFDVWRQGFQWTITANEQVGTARDNILLQRFLLRWYERAASRRDFYKQVDAVSNRLCQRAFFRIWKHRFKERLKEKQQAEWRQDMRMKIQLVRQKRDTRILREAWSEWAQSHKLILAEQHFSEQVVVRLFRRWKTRLRGVYEKEAVADDMFRSRMDGVVEMYWDHWRSYTELARMEKMMSKRVGLRIMGDALDTWNKKTHDIQAADAFHNVIVVKNAIRSWKAARDRIRRLALIGILVIEMIFFYALLCGFGKHSERGKLLEKVKAFRLTKAAWAVWKAQLDSQRKLEDMALRFSTRLQSSSAKIAFHSWRQVLSAQQSAQLLAMQKHSVWVYRRTLLQWRLNLHKQLKMAKKARLAEKYLVLRRSWNLLKEKYCERIADKKRRASEQLMVKNLFQVWLQRSQKLRHTRLAEEVIQDQVRKRVLTKFLTHWTNRVIEIKLLELEVAQRNEAALLIHFFKRWKKVRARHVEELGLMQSYQDIKREDNVRKIFHKWLTATRTVRLRCNVLEQKEQQIKREAIIMAWDRWRTLLEMKRERFQDERLRPLELQFRFQNKEALKYRAFATWFSKTQALPAIHFDAQRVKTKYWRAWRSAMPRALQAKKAREVDKNALLKKSLEKWLQVYRTKLTLKAVARARYFPAPSAPSSRPSPFSRLPPLSFAPRSNTSRNIFPRRAARSASPDEEDPGPSNNSPASRFVGLASRLAVPTRARSEVSPTRTLISAPRTRASSPARSTRSSIPLPSYLRDRSPVRPPSPSSAGGEERSSLWQEIQDVRRKSQTPSEILRASRKPP